MQFREASSPGWFVGGVPPPPGVCCRQGGRAGRERSGVEFQDFKISGFQDFKISRLGMFGAPWVTQIAVLPYPKAPRYDLYNHFTREDESCDQVKGSETNLE